jgi:uncharacterized protein YndB with AHSA1/START domain
MTERSVTHATFVIERTFDSAPVRVFAAWADAAAKAQWFRGPDEDANTTFSLDFRIGGRERNRAEAGGHVYGYEALYQDIVPNERIIYTYEMQMDEKRISVSVATIEFTPQGEGTQLILTEQGAFLDGLDEPAAREHGTRELLDALGTVLQRESANA